MYNFISYSLLKGGIKMSLFNNVSEIVSIKGMQFADKAKTLTDIASLQGQITTNKSSIYKKYRELGKKYYQAHKNDPTAEFYDLVADIKAFEKSIENLQLKINTIKGTLHCSNCGADVPNYSKYCLKCGTKIEEPFYDDEDSSLELPSVNTTSIMDEDE